MVAAVGGSVGLGSPDHLYLSQKYQSFQGLGSVSTLSAYSMNGGYSDSMSISGPGQLYSDLQQLHATDRTKFTQVVTVIASQVQVAAQQAGPGSQQGVFLSKLASKFESVAKGGDLAQLQPHKPQNKIAAAYSVGGPDSSQSLLGLGQQSSSSSTTGVSFSNSFRTSRVP